MPPRKRGIQYAAASRFNHQRLWNTGIARFARAMTSESVARSYFVRCDSAFPRRKAPESCMNRSPKKTEGVGNAGCPMHPQPRMQSRKHTSVVTTGPPEKPGIPARNGFNGFLRALPGDRACLSPSSAEMDSANLTPASRRQDHTPSPSASALFVKLAARVHRIPPRVRDDRDTPLWGVGRYGYSVDLGQAGTEIF